MKRIFAIVLLLPLAGCDDYKKAVAPRPAPESATGAATIDVRVRQVRLDALKLPSAQLVVKNLGSTTLETVSLKCIFYGPKDQLIGDGVGVVSNLAAGASDV